MTAVLVALLTIGGTLAGVLVGGWNERRRWLRDKRLEAYTAFVAAVNAWMLAYTRAGRVTQELNDDMRVVMDAGQRVRLLGPAAVTDKVFTIAEKMFEVMVQFEAEGTSSVELHQARLEVIALSLDALVNAAQVQLQGGKRKLRRSTA